MPPVRNSHATPRALCLACEAMGTRFECVLAGSDEPRLRAAAEVAFAEIESLHSRWSYFSGASLVSRINQEAARRPVPLDADTHDLLRLSLDTWQGTGGCFDITVAPLMRRWGLRGGPHLERATDLGLPATRPLAAEGDMREPPPWGSHHLRLDSAAMTIAFATQGLEIDLGAIAKGAALDAAASILRDAGIASALLHGGTSSIIAIGAPPDSSRGWPIRLGPFAGSPVVHLRDAALGVSAHHGRTARAGDQTVGHIIDPRTGAPSSVDSGRSERHSDAPGGPGSPGFPNAALAACVHPSAALADAWSTALLVRGSAQALQLPPDLHAALRLQHTWTYSDHFHHIATLGAHE